ncbi:MAG: right-handed parallel beta-helix repeat-containing protein, partial [Fibrobacterota bacterium]
DGMTRLRGDNATTPTSLNYWSETRGIVKIGGSNTSSTLPKFVRLENLDISGARSVNTFTDDGNNTVHYDANAAGVFVESGEDITISGCRLHDNGNGLFVAWEAKNVLVRWNTILDNGNTGSVYEHNSYTEADGITFDLNDYGPLCAGCLGNNLKDRSAGTIIRLNRIDGGNRQLDLVDSDHEEIRSRPGYRRTFVYGNYLVERDGSGNRQMIHYGGDNGDESIYRHGILHLYDNTFWSDRTDRNTLIRLSSTQDTADIRNNVLYTNAPGSSLEILAGAGVALLRNNWLPLGWRTSFDPIGTVTETGTNPTGTDPKFVNFAAQDMRLTMDSPLHGQAGPLSPDVDSALVPRMAFYSITPSIRFTDRGDTGAIGAFSSSNKYSTGIIARSHSPMSVPGLGFRMEDGFRQIVRQGGNVFDVTGKWLPRSIASYPPNP